jgi:hypothetical protein
MHLNGLYSSNQLMTWICAKFLPFQDFSYWWTMVDQHVKCGMEINHNWTFTCFKIIFYDKYGDCKSSSSYLETWGVFQWIYAQEEITALYNYRFVNKFVLASVCRQKHLKETSQFLSMNCLSFRPRLVWCKEPTLLGGSQFRILPFSIFPVMIEAVRRSDRLCR